MRGPEALVAAARDHGVDDERLLAAIREVPRDRFVAPEFAGQAYADGPLPITHGQVTSQPSLIASMVDALGLTGDEKVLEVGAGYGWQTALLARLARHVWAIEMWPDMVRTASANLAAAGIENVDVLLGDGTEGLPEHAPFDAIVLTAAFPAVPQPLIDQLADGGRLVQPIGPGGAETVTLLEKTPEGLKRLRSVTLARFVPLYGRYAYSRD